MYHLLRVEDIPPLDTNTFINLLVVSENVRISHECEG